MPTLLNLPFSSAADASKSPRFTEVVNGCTGWNVGVWGRAFQAALGKIGHERIKASSVLEIGASHYSSLAVAFSFLGADSTASYLLNSPEPLINELSSRFNITKSIPVKRIDIRESYNGEKFDLVVAKSVLGTPTFSRNDEDLMHAVQNLKSMVSPGGILLTLDNAVGVWPQHWLRNKYGTGRDGWRYFNRADYEHLILNEDSEFMSFGLTSFVEFGQPWLQGCLASFDRKFDWLAPKSMRSVFVGITPVP